jgi:mRNA interferase RelE/StbE
MYRVFYKKSAIKDLRKLSKTEELKIRRIISDLEKNPRPNRCKKIKKYKDIYRIRTGNYRIIYSIVYDILTVEIFKIAQRKDVYKNL